MKLRTKKIVDKGNTAYILTFILIVFLFVTIFSILGRANRQSKEKLIDFLLLEKKLNEENASLKVEIANLMKERFALLLAEEKLGLRKANEKETYVMK